MALRSAYAYLLTSLALRSDGVLYLTRQMKKLTGGLAVDSKRSEQGNKNQSVQKLIPDMFISNSKPMRHLWISSVRNEEKKARSRDEGSRQSTGSSLT
jgi:hypothetical protein